MGCGWVNREERKRGNYIEIVLTMNQQLTTVKALGTEGACWMGMELEGMVHGLSLRFE